MKKKIVMLLACSMVMGAVPVMASEVEEVTEVTTQDLNEVSNETQLPPNVTVTTEAQTGDIILEAEFDGTQEVEPYENHLELTNEPLSFRTIHWKQPDGYLYYRISIENYSSVPIKVYYGASAEHMVNVAGNTTYNSPNHTTVPGIQHSIDISNADGSAPKGFINVRVSTLPL